MAKDPLSKGFARAVLVGLTVECPQGDNSESCLFKEKRELTFSDKFGWVKSLSGDELLEVYAAHCDCVEIKTRGESK